MGKIHSLIETNGRQGALALDYDRKVVETAVSYMSNEDNTVSFLYSGFAHVVLPHKRIANDAAWQVSTDRATMVVEPGRRPSLTGTPEYVGVPYGSKARLILLYLQSEAVKTQSRQVDLGGSFRSWIKLMGIPQGGKSIADVREQAERIARCRLTFEFQNIGNSSGIINQNIIDSARFFTDADGHGKTRLIDSVQLSELFFEQLMKHPIPMEESAIRSLNGLSQALDIYCWLAYRLHCLKTPTPITWAALKAQFGPGVERMAHFRSQFLSSLQMALAVYPDAKVDSNPQGLILSPSRPPVAPKLYTIKKIRE
ncbi:plasmid replication initiator [Neokomagataea tanensis NBRC 106556]|uniref:Plasmid replication initiator n=2 Tax=Acetobacteraceae TaxID=433 RepID=A0ABQ0QL24_9PROT|nr:plasmid replication initiator [Neokomagataea tanensis NBRC 106556]